MNILLLEPDYYTRYPPLGLMKLASYYRSRGDRVKLVRGTAAVDRFVPDRVEVTSLFTYAWDSVHKAIRHVQGLFPDASIRVGGIYASLMPNHIRASFPRVKVHKGLYPEAEGFLPAYDLLEETEKWKGWDTSIVFTSRGCIRNCPFCMVPRVEGRFRSVASNLDYQISPSHSKVSIWDNNFLASPDWRRVLGVLEDEGLKVDFNQGLDARLIDEEKAKAIVGLDLPLLRMAFDTASESGAIDAAVDLLSDSGARRRSMLFYSLFNFFDARNNAGDTPSDFLDRARRILNLGCVSYPMRYEPLDSLRKNQFVSPFWTDRQLELIAKARRVIGYGGAFPPYKGLIDKIDSASCFDQAFSLNPSTLPS